MTIAEIKAHREEIDARLHEAKALLDEVEAHAKKNKAQAEIERLKALKAKKEEIEKRWHRQLKTAGEAALALKVKSEIEADLEKFKNSLAQIEAELKTQAAAN